MIRGSKKPYTVASNYVEHVLLQTRHAGSSHAPKQDTYTFLSFSRYRNATEIEVLLPPLNDDGSERPTGSEGRSEIGACGPDTIGACGPDTYNFLSFSRYRNTIEIKVLLSPLNDDRSERPTGSEGRSEIGACGPDTIGACGPDTYNFLSFSRYHNATEIEVLLPPLNDDGSERPTGSKGRSEIGACGTRHHRCVWTGHLQFSLIFTLL